jgi:hypothetical protein
LNNEDNGLDSFDREALDTALKVLISEIGTAVVVDAEPR